MPVAFEPFVRGLEQWELSNWQALVEPDPDLNELLSEDDFGLTTRELFIKHILDRKEMYEPKMSLVGTVISAAPKSAFPDGRPTASTKLTDANDKMKKASLRTRNFSLPAGESRSGESVCPHAGACRAAAGCYAKNGSYIWKNCIEANEWRYELTKDKDNFFRLMDADLKKSPPQAMRVHDSGDFYSPAYLDTWLELAKANPKVLFYAYTKSVKFVKDAQAAGKVPKNFVFIFSYGGNQDKMIDPAVDRHAKVFGTLEELEAADYVYAGSDDSVAATADNNKIGLVFHGKGEKKERAWFKRPLTKEERAAVEAQHSKVLEACKKYHARNVELRNELSALRKVKVPKADASAVAEHKRQLDTLSKELMGIRHAQMNDINKILGLKNAWTPDAAQARLKEILGESNESIDEMEELAEAIEDETKKDVMGALGDRAAKKAEKTLNDEIGRAWPKYASGVQVPIMEIPKIFVAIKQYLNEGKSMQEAVETAASNFRVNGSSVRANASKLYDINSKEEAEEDLNLLGVPFDPSLTREAIGGTSGLDNTVTLRHSLTYIFHEANGNTIAVLTPDGILTIRDGVALNASAPYEAKAMKKGPKFDTSTRFMPREGLYPSGEMPKVKPGTSHGKFAYPKLRRVEGGQPPIAKKLDGTEVTPEEIEEAKELYVFGPEFTDADIKDYIEQKKAKGKLKAATEVATGPVSKRFAELIRAQLSPEEMEQAIEENEESGYDPGQCSTADFCDANELMDQAIREVYPDFYKANSSEREVDPGEEEPFAMTDAMTDLFNDAWQEAKEHDFWATTKCATCGRVLRYGKGEVFLGEEGATYCNDHAPQNPFNGEDEEEGTPWEQAQAEKERQGHIDTIREKLQKGLDDPEQKAEREQYYKEAKAEARAKYLEELKKLGLTEEQVEENKAKHAKESAARKKEVADRMAAEREATRVKFPEGLNPSDIAKSKGTKHPIPGASQGGWVTIAATGFAKADSQAITKAGEGPGVIESFTVRDLGPKEDGDTGGMPKDADATVWSIDAPNYAEACDAILAELRDRGWEVPEALKAQLTQGKGTHPSVIDHVAAEILKQHNDGTSEMDEGYIEDAKGDLNKAAHTLAEEGWRRSWYDVNYLVLVDFKVAPHGGDDEKKSPEKLTAANQVNRMPDKPVPAGSYILTDENDVYQLQPDGSLVGVENTDNAGKVVFPDLKALGWKKKWRVSNENDDSPQEDEWMGDIYGAAFRRKIEEDRQEARQVAKDAFLNEMVKKLTGTTGNLECSGTFGNGAFYQYNVNGTDVTVYIDDTKAEVLENLQKVLMETHGVTLKQIKDEIKKRGGAEFLAGKRFVWGTSSPAVGLTALAATSDEAYQDFLTNLLAPGEDLEVGKTYEVKPTEAKPSAGAIRPEDILKAPPMEPVNKPGWEYKPWTPKASQKK